MANPVYTQDIVVDADGKPFLNALEPVQGFIENISKLIQGIGITSKKDAEAWGLALAQNIQMLRRAQSDLNTLRKMDASPQKQATRDATFEAAQAARLRGVAGLDRASLDAERRASDERIARLRTERREVAEKDADAARGIAQQIAAEKTFQNSLIARGRTLERLSDQDTRERNKTHDAIKRQISDEENLARARERNYDRALKQVAAPARRRMTEDQMWAPVEVRPQTRYSPNLQERLGENIAAQLNNERMGTAQLTRDIEGLRTLRRAAARDEALDNKTIRQSRFEAAKAAAADNIKQIRDFDELSKAREKNVNELRRLREAQRTVTDRTQLEAIAKLIQLENARATAIQQTARELAKLQGNATSNLTGASFKNRLALAGQEVRQQAYAGEDPRFIQLQRRAELELAYTRLQEVAKGNDIAAQQVARENVRIAEKRVTVANQLVAQSERQLNLDRRSMELEARVQQSISMKTVGQFARQQIESLGATKAIQIARERTAIAEERLLTANRQNHAELQRQLELARAQQRETEKQGRGGPLSQILSPGYAATAFARTAVYGTAAMAAYGAFNAVQGGFSEVVQLEDELVKLQAIANATTPQMQQLKAAIFDIGATSRYSTVDLVKISQTLAQAGVTAGDMKSVLQSVTTLATASGSTPDEAVNLVTAALGSFQLQASEAARVADLMTSALNRTKLTVQQTGQAIQYVGATAFEQNISLEQLLGTVGAVAQAGVRSGSTIGTGFRQFLVDLQNPSEKLTEQLKMLGLTADQVNVSVRGLPAVLETLRDAGFGSAQAYGSLETRAAAFYLVAKNNVDIMDQLQLAFATSGAAAVANERAMGSLTAQWQRFKNILVEDFFEGMEGPLDDLKNILQLISDEMAKGQVIADQMAKNRAGGAAGYIERDGNFWGTLKYIDENPGSLLGLDQIAEMEKQWDAWAFGIREASEASQLLETQVSDTSEAVDKQTGKISELDKEMVRLIAQKESLRGHDLRSQSEIATLTSRFQGLAIYLTNTGNRYDDLTNAVRRYRLEQLRLLNVDLTAQSSALNLQRGEAQRAGGSAITGLLNDRGAMGALTRAEQGALRALLTNRVSSVEGQNAQGILRDAVARLSGNNLELSRRVNEVVQAAGTIATTTQQLRTNEAQRANAGAAQTPVGQRLTEGLQGVEAELQRLNGLTGNEQSTLANQLLSQLTGLEGVANRALGRNPNEGNRTFLRDMLTELGSYRNQVTAAITPTKAEERAAAAEERARQREEREAQRRERLVTQKDVDEVGLELGLKLGSGTRTPAEQEALYRRGVTPARGSGPRTSNHVSGTARDFSVAGLSDEQAERMATTLRARYRARGIEAQVLYERGGPNNGTGRHIHVGVARGAMQRSDRTEENADRYEQEVAQAQAKLDQADLATKIKEVARATTRETFDTAVTNAKTALDKVNSQLGTIAADELALNGVAPGSATYEARLLQVEQEVAQNIENFNQKVTDAILKSIKRQVEAAETAFEQGMRSSRTSAEIAQAEVAGLGAYSLRNRVPDYTAQLANDRVAQAQEAVVRAQAQLLPGRIAAQETAISDLQGRLGSDGADAELINQQLKEMNLELEVLRANKAALDAQLGAGGLLPTTVSEGLNQAIAAYRQANAMGRDISQELIMSLGGAIDTINGGLTEMFSGILSGSQSALGAFGNFAKGIMNYMTQMAAKMLATRVLELLFNVVGGAVGGGAATNTAPNNGTNMTGPIVKAIGLNGGGEVTNGSPSEDSVVPTKLTKGEWVIQRPAVESVGHDFMARLNQHGSKALEGLNAMPKLDMRTTTETNVWVVPGEQPKPMGPDDVVVIMTNELLNGDSKRLVQHISRESR